MNFFNLNFLHNVINVTIAALGALLLSSGCVAVTGGGFDCSQSWISPHVTMWGEIHDCEQSWISPHIVTWMITVLAAMKVVLNVLRDGFFGLVKVQPPVVDKPVIK